LRSHARSKAGLYSRIARGLAGFSYTLYVVHLPALVFISAWIVPYRRWQPDAVHVAIVAAIGICALGYAFAIAWLTEYRTDAIRTRVMGAMGARG
jgi:peptidoglycan/LPS O-acetylase OafA/YrhL